MKNFVASVSRWTAFVLVLNTLVSMSQAAQPVDVSEFLRRAESMGLSTHFMRRTFAKIEVFAGNPGGGAEASWGYILKNITIDKDMLEEGTNRIRFDLSMSQTATLYHELTHAANSVMADSNLPRIAPAGAHHAVIEAIRADIFVKDEKTAFLGLPRYPRVKADEVSGYFMGLSMMELYQDVHTLITMSKMAPMQVIKKPGDAARWGGKFVEPDDSLVYRNIVNRTYGQTSLKQQTYFEGKQFQWDPERSALKAEMWDKFLALDTPKTGAELIERLNSLENPWIESVRESIREAREEYEAKLIAESNLSAEVEAGQQELPHTQDLFGFATE